MNEEQLAQLFEEYNEESAIDHMSIRNLSPNSPNISDEMLEQELEYLESDRF